MNATDAPIIEACGLVRRYGERLAVAGVDFTVARGEIFGFLGPNGAGKSTTVRMLTGYVPPSGGTARIAGFDVSADPVAARAHIGIVPEEANVYIDLTVWQNVMLMAELHAIGRRQRTERGTELLGLFGLVGRERQKGRDLSKGLRQRLMLCMALVADPKILFLDEPTSGLDVASSQVIQGVIMRMNRERGTTVFMTTHNIDEADKLCHRVAIINQGRLAVVDTPRALRATIEARRSVEVRFAVPGVVPAEVLPLSLVAEVVPLADGFRVYAAEPGHIAQEIAMRSAAKGIGIVALNTVAPSLEDVFMQITSRTAALNAEVTHDVCTTN
jgi:ABC-2 type transport system ATP-binding protein